MRSLIIAALLACCFAVPAFARRTPSFGPSSEFLAPSAPLLADFDGDNRVDQAVVVRGPVKTIHVRFGKSSSRFLTFNFDSSEHGRLFSGDIDSDGDLDILWVSQSSGRFLTWQGDGRGNFSLDSDAKIAPGQLQAFLGSAPSPLVDDSNPPDFTGLLVTTVLLLPRAFGYDHELQFRAPLARIPTPRLSASHSPALRQRGPPLFPVL